MMLSGAREGERKEREGGSKRSREQAREGTSERGREGGTENRFGDSAGGRG